MNNNELFQYLEDVTKKMVATAKKKNADYAGAGEVTDPFFNFTGVERAGICLTEQGFLTRMWDKFARITTFVKKGVLQVQDESVEDTLLDLANYCLLMAAYIKSKRTKDDRLAPVIKVSVGEKQDERLVVTPEGELTVDAEGLRQSFKKRKKLRYCKLCAPHPCDCEYET